MRSAIIFPVMHTHALTQYKGSNRQNYTPTCTLFGLYLEERLWYLNSFGIKFELNKSADLPLRQCLSYREHRAIKPGSQKHCGKITHGGLWFGRGLTREKRDGTGGEDTEFGFSVLHKKDWEIHTGGFSVCKQFVGHTEDNDPSPFYPSCSCSPHIAQHFCPFVHTIKCFAVLAQVGSLRRLPCFDLRGLPLRTRTKEEGSIGADRTCKAEVTGKRFESGEHDLWRTI